MSHGIGEEIAEADFLPRLILIWRPRAKARKLSSTAFAVRPALEGWGSSRHSRSRGALEIHNTPSVSLRSTPPPSAGEEKAPITDGWGQLSVKSSEWTLAACVNILTLHTLEFLALGRK